MRSVLKLRLLLLGREDGNEVGSVRHALGMAQFAQTGLYGFLAQAGLIDNIRYSGIAQPKR